MPAASANCQCASAPGAPGKRMVRAASFSPAWLDSPVASRATATWEKPCELGLSQLAHSQVFGSSQRTLKNPVAWADGSRSPERA